MEAPICCKCRREVSRKCSGEDFTANWDKVNNSPQDECAVLSCMSPVEHSSSMKNMELLFNSAELRCRHETIPHPTPLCHSHYKTIYGIHNPWHLRINCVTSGMSLRRTKARLCPNPEVIEKMLNENTEFEHKINPDDKICPTCYKSHLAMLKDDKADDTEGDLISSIEMLTQQVTPIDDIKTESDVVEYAMSKTTIDVGNLLLQGEVLLLSTAHDIYKRYEKEIMQNKRLDFNMKMITITARRVLAKLKANFGKYLMFACKVRKYGTLIYQANTDMITAISHALWKIRHFHSDSSHLAHDPNIHVQPTETNTINYKSFLDDLNQRILATAKQLLENDSTKQLDYSKLNIDEAIQNIDPILWEAIMNLTRSISENRGTSKLNDIHSDVYSLKRIRCFFILSTLLFCADNRCSMLLHTLLTDVIQSQGASHLLIKILNRFGICSSVDVLQRYMTYKVSQPKADSLSENTTIEVVSVDNIDFYIVMPEYLMVIGRVVGMVQLYK